MCRAGVVSGAVRMRCGAVTRKIKVREGEEEEETERALSLWVNAGEGDRRMWVLRGG